MSPSNSPNSAAASCTVVVCTRDRPAELERCLDALKKLDWQHYDILVVDNAPSDDRTRRLTQRHAVGYLVEPLVGANRARNRGARASSAEIIAFTDDDAVPEPGWLAALVDEFRDPQVVAVTGHVVALRVETEAERLCAQLQGSRVGGSERFSLDRETPQWFERANFGGLGILANMAVRRAVFDLWPGFDERLDRGMPLDGYGEHLAFFSLIERGGRIVYTPNAVVRHALPETMEALRRRHLRDLANATAYMTLLFFEHPAYRRSVIRYLTEALRGTPRPWRSFVPAKPPQFVARWRKALARICGPFIYLRMLLHGRAEKR